VAVEVEAKVARVEYRAAMVTAVNPWEGIIRTAKAKGCDLIVMSSRACLDYYSGARPLRCSPIARCRFWCTASR
jgi:hypothetical protein